jgi:hypothetical protein
MIRRVREQELSFAPGRIALNELLATLALFLFIESSHRRNRAFHSPEWKWTLERAGLDLGAFTLLGALVYSS